MNHRLMVAALAAVLCTGSMAPSGASDLLGQSYISLEALSLGSGFQKVLAEDKPAESIRKSVIRDLDIPEEAWRATKYSYNYAEGENGEREVLVLLRGPWTSGTMFLHDKVLGPVITAAFGSWIETGLPAFLALAVCVLGYLKSHRK